jgi:methylmalonyl-CoA/ethylmalonyl-CoA epimerase
VKFHHVGLIVGSLEIGKQFLEKVNLGMSFGEEIEDTEIGVKVQFGVDNQGLRYELVAPLNEQSLIWNYLHSRDNMLHHMAFLVDEFDQKRLELRSTGCVPLSEPMRAAAFQGRRVAFFLTPLRTILEIIESEHQIPGFESV